MRTTGIARLRALAPGAAALGALALAACGSAGPMASDFEVGMARAQVVERFGEPASRRQLVKTQPHIFGPIESFWDAVPLGAQVEIWSYPVAGGAAELYFVGASADVRGTGFADSEAVY